MGASGNRIGVNETGGRTLGYTYDNLYRLTGETISGVPLAGVISYIYDAVGNRQTRSSTVPSVASVTQTYSNNDWLNSDDYDNNGNTTQSEALTYTYDYENRITSASNGVQIVYDGDGNRVSKTFNGVTTQYLVDTNNLTGYAQVVEEVNPGNQVVKVYSFGTELISQTVAGAGLSFYGFDGHGSVRYLTDLNGALTDTYTYDAFGILIGRTGATDNNFLYCGEQFDPQLGFYYLRARYMNPNTGRFWTMDSYEGGTGDPLSLHKYTFGNGCPVSNRDPSGHDSIGSLMMALAVTAIICVAPIAMWEFRNSSYMHVPANEFVPVDISKLEVHYHCVVLHNAPSEDRVFAILKQFSKLDLAPVTANNDVGKVGDEVEFHLPSLVLQLGRPIFPCVSRDLTKTSIILSLRPCPVIL